MKKDGTEGVCPYCGNKLLIGDYETLNIVGTEPEPLCNAFAKFRCSTCGNSGKEWFSITYIYHEIEDVDSGGLIT